MTETRIDTQGMTRRRLLGRLGGGLTALLLAAAVGAPWPATAAQLMAADLEQVARVEAYLNGIGSLSARFQQFSSDGELALGSIYVRRPGRMRVEYDPPVSVILVADGILVSYYDHELDQLNQLPLSASPAWFLLRDPIDLTKDVTVTGVRQGPGVLRVTMHQTDEPEAGAVTLVFSDQPLELRQWTLTDAQGREVRIGLHDVKMGGELANKLFATPRRRSGPGSGDN